MILCMLNLGFKKVFTCEDLICYVLSCVHQVLKTPLKVVSLPSSRLPDKNQGLGGERGQGRTIHRLHLVQALVCLISMRHLKNLFKTKKS